MNQRRNFFFEIAVCTVWVFMLVELVSTAKAGDDFLGWLFGFVLCTMVAAFTAMTVGFDTAIMHHPRHAHIPDDVLDNFIRQARACCGDPDPTRKEFVIDTTFLRWLVKYTLITFTVFDRKLPEYEVEERGEEA